MRLRLSLLDEFDKICKIPAYPLNKHAIAFPTTKIRLTVIIENDGQADFSQRCRYYLRMRK